MAKKDMVKIEYLIILVSMFIILLWAISRCGAQREKVLQDKSTDLQNTDTSNLEGVYGSLPAAQPNLATPAGTNTSQSATTTPAATAPVPNEQVNTAAPANNLTKLYIVMDGVNLRNVPQLKSEVVAKLPLFEEVYFLNQVTDTTQELSIGKEVVNEPWVKVRTKHGKEGWVYGAYVDYYKKKRKGAI